MRHQTLRGFRDILLTTTALVAALAGGGRAAVGGSAPASNGLSGFNVVSGGATLSTPSATKSIITQSTNKAIITWSAFGIPLGSTVQFVQPGASSVALNRVTGGNVSNIMGSLLANGQVWIINPAGVFFGPGAQVDVAGLMATTADIANNDFLSGNYKFGIGSQNPNASIVNQGTIRTTNGSTVLVGAQVTNQGLIAAQMGSVVLGGAKTFAVDFQGDKLLSFQVTGPVDQTPQNADGTPATALVTNTGRVTATGGTVLLTARAAKNVIDNVINSSGIVEATSAKSVNGEIVLDGGDTGSVSVSGTLDASGKAAGETGGTVKVLGDQVTLAAGANIDVSGDAGGGTALVGGDFHGAGPEQNASTTTISAGSQINASAITKGNGGAVAVWSDTATSISGTITAKGGSAGGNGGLIETSGKSQLAVAPSAVIDASAPRGVAGSWLLDPGTVTLGGSFVSVAVIDSDLSAGTNVVVSATGNISVQANITDTGSIGVALTLASNTSAGGNGVITFANNTSILSTNGPLSVSLLTGSGSGSSIVLGSGSVLDTQGGDLFFSSKVLLGTAAGSTGVVTLKTTGVGGPGAVTFSSSVDDLGGGSVGLSLNAGAVQFSGSVGAGTPLASLGVTATSSTLHGTAVHTTGDDTFSGQVVLANNNTLTSDTRSVTLAGPVDGAFALSLIASSGTVSLGNVGASTPLTSLLVDPAAIVLKGTTYDTSGDQTYSVAVTLGADATLASTAGNINFLGTVDGPFALSATASSGTVGVGKAIGSQTALSSFSASGETVSLSGIGSSGRDGVTGAVSIAGSSLIALAGTAYHSGGSQSLSGPVTLLHDETMTSDSGDIRFVGTTSTIDGGFALALSTSSSSGTVSLGGSVGGLTRLTSLVVDPATITLGGSTYHTAFDQTYSAGVSLGADATLTSDHGSIDFLATIDGNHSLSLSAASGTVSVGQLIGGETALASLLASGNTVSLSGIDHSGSAGVVGEVSVTATNEINLAGSAYHTGGSESFTGPVALLNNESLTSDSGSITFASTVDGAFGLTAAAAATTFEGSVGSSTALASL
ncbi:MAG TPA: filamentous hemagglutinin N-terminal domain-containing protein, partial [Stellaceae bacterium]|nr:filamentous hemagglutinin N-terminal domain-containing protein [Stellaceae bacterium]